MTDWLASLQAPKERTARTARHRTAPHAPHGTARSQRRRAEHKAHVWTGDFIHDRTAGGQPLKWLAVTDEYTRECLALEVHRSITADRVLEILTHLFLTRGVPKPIRSDNGPEFIAGAIRRHAERAGASELQGTDRCRVRVRKQATARRMDRRV